MPILINDNTARVQYTATSGQTVFAVPFEFFENSDLKVYRNSTLQTITTHYTLTGAGVTGGGNLTFVSGVTLNDIITIVRDIPIQRVTDFPLSGPFNITALNLQLDQLTAMIQEVNTLVTTRVPLLAEFDQPSAFSALPTRANRANNYFVFDANGNPAVASSALAVIDFIAAGAGAVTRSVESKLRDTISVKDFGAAGDGTSDDTAAITAADAVSGKIYSPGGVYNTTLASTALRGPFWGQGQIEDSANNKRAPWFSAIAAAPSPVGNANSVETAFNGDLAAVQLPIEHRITGTTLGQPTTGYDYTNEAYPVFGYLYNSSGWNQSTSGNDGRTAACFARVKVDNYGQGDCVAYNATAFVTGAKAGATSFLANPAASLFNGDMTAGQAGVYLNPYEIALNDNGFDVACIGHVINMDRTVATGALGAWWSAFRAQSTGSASVNNILSGVGKFNTGIDMTMSNLDFGANQAAISLKQGQRIYLNNASSNDNYSTTFNGDYIAYSSGISGILLVAGGTPSLQVTSSQVTTTVTTVVPGLRVNAATATATAGQLAFGTTTAATATAGAAGALPLQVLGYLVANLGGTTIKIPYYAN